MLMNMEMFHVILITAVARIQNALMFIRTLEIQELQKLYFLRGKILKLGNLFSLKLGLN
jgi:hypothetical protein